MGGRGRAGQFLERRALLGLLAGLAACGPVTGGRLLADQRVLRAIRAHYDAHAREDEGCGEPFMTRIKSGRITGDAAFGAPTRATIEYEWEAPSAIPSGPRCRGEGRRTFAVLRTAEGPVVTAMSGPVR
jgi:hypothetical protein